MTRPHTLEIAMVQISPVWLKRDETLVKVVAALHEAADTGAQFIVFGGEVLVPGYVYWTQRTDGARFGDPEQKNMHRLYVEQAVCIEEGHLDPVTEAARARGVAIVLGILERPLGRGGHSVYASAVHISAEGRICSVHRKLIQTYEERLSWGIGDGHGLRTHPVGPFTVGTLNCWENWMPLARAAMYAAGEDLHVALWPGSDTITRDITPFIAREGRSYVISASAMLRTSDMPADTPMRDRIAARSGEFLGNGGSCLAGPDGEWIIEPQVGVEGIFTASLDHRRVLEERHNFDPAGHYARPDVLSLRVNRKRQSTAEFED
jgi:nitrilase